MSAIRPLATIAVLAALGAFLAVQINEQGPVAFDEGSLEPWVGGAADDTAGEAPLFDAGDVSLTPRTAPPAPEVTTAPAFSAPPAADAALPELPPLPSLPADSGPSGVGASAPAAPAAATPPPAAPSPFNEQAPAAPPAVSGRVPSLGAATPDLAAATPPPAAAPAAPASPFDGVWPLIQAALERDELTRAHLLLSQWRDEPSLSANQQADVNVLLDALAGSVVYSMEHRLEPPHTVAAGETLKTIADRYGVSWRLLGKINGVARPDAVTPGALLKVVRGPFTAELSLADNEMVVLLDGRYAGRFPVQVEGAAAAAGQWRVERADAGARSPGMVLGGPGGTISIDASPVASPEHQGRITVASRDAADIGDILTVGSTVAIRR